MKISSGPIGIPAGRHSDELQIIGVICEGSAFRIYKARSGTKFVTVKAAVSREAMSIDFLRREYEISRSLSHPCIVNTTGFMEDSPVGAAIIMEFIDGLTLDEYVAQGPGTKHREAVLKDILDGVDYLHHRGILHNDLKPDNIIVNSNNSARIIDFGLSLSDDSIYKGHTGGSDGYSAPEIVKGSGPAGAASDIYSIGRLIKLIFEGKKYTAIAEKCSRESSGKRYQSIPEIKRALSIRRILPWVALATTVFLLVAVPIAVQALKPDIQIVQDVQKIEKEEKILSLEDKFEMELSGRFNAALERIQEQKYREGALTVENEYFEYFLSYLDSLQKLYPASGTGESSPEVAALCVVGQRQQNCADSIIMSLPSKIAIP